MTGWLPISILLASGVVRPVVPPGKPRAVTIQPLAGPVLNMTATPSTISFQATNPDSPSDPGSSAATVTWNANGGNNKSWSLTVRSYSSAFTGCATVPVSAVTVSCSSATITGNGTGTCSAPFALSTTPQQLVSGREGSNNASYTITLTFTLTDSWRYIAKLSPQCSLALTYTANLN